jgi:hypothetical protein
MLIIAEGPPPDWYTPEEFMEWYNINTNVIWQCAKNHHTGRYRWMIAFSNGVMHGGYSDLWLYRETRGLNN